MTPRERVIEALGHKRSGIVPYNVFFTPRERKRLAAYTGDSEFDRDWTMHLHTCMYDGWPERLPGERSLFRDEFGVLHDRSVDEGEWGVVASRLVDFEDNHYVFPPLDEGRWRRDIEQMLSGRGDKFIFPALGCSLYERAWTLAGMEELLVAMAMYPSMVHELLDKICDRNMRVIDIAMEYDVDGFYFGDDWGSQRGTIMSPEHWRTFFKPRFARMYGRVKERGGYVLHHSCGDIKSVMPDLIEMGCDCYETVQPEIYDLAELKREYGADVTFWGAISVQQLLPQGTPEQVREETIRTIDLMGKDGGYIASPTHVVPDDVPPENVFAMMEVFERQE